MNINWKIKSSIFKLIDDFSLYKLLYFLQKNITRRAKVKIPEIKNTWKMHKNNLSSLNNTNILEFGAGKNLAQNIFLSQYFNTQTVVDLFPMLDISLFNDAVLQISKLIPTKNFSLVSNKKEIYENYRIQYIAPFDIAKTVFTDSYFDGFISTNTLEHVPCQDIVSIFKELKRIIRTEGLISVLIDYSDHYSHTDKSIGPLNFLRYSSEEFKKFNHRSHYQNRLRHYDYLSIFQELGFLIIKNETLSFANPPKLISDEFDKTNNLLYATKGVFLLQIKK